jgi:UDP-2,3-diacylglucosamine pyrophosphatase LpxH
MADLGMHGSERSQPMVQSIADLSWPDAATPERKHYRSIWISDFHLGTVRCKAESLLDFLRHHTAESLFMVGDVIDGWNVGPGWCWNAAQTAVVEELWAWRRRGTRMIFLPGNHDEHSTEMVHTLFGAVECHEEFVHRTAEGRKMLVTHGHQFDGSLHAARWMSLIGSLGYSAALKLNVWYNRESPTPESSRCGATRAMLRRRLKSAVHNLIDFCDEQVTRGVRDRNVDGVICGHTHRPDHRMIGPILYSNDGDWVQSRTALVEEPSGELRLLRWKPSENRSREENP